MSSRHPKQRPWYPDSWHDGYPSPHLDENGKMYWRRDLNFAGLWWDTFITMGAVALAIVAVVLVVR